MTKYNFKKTINSNKLLEEITKSDINVLVNNITLLTDGSFNVWFKADLDAGNLTILNNLVTAHDASGVQEVTITGGFVKDANTGKLTTKDEPYNGPLYVPFCRFITGLNDSTWQPPASNSTNNFWSIDISDNTLTKVSFMPNYNYQIDGIGYRVIGSAVDDVVMKKVLLAPDLAPYTFSENRLLNSGDEYERFTSPKYVKYYGAGPYLTANKVQFVISHNETERARIELFVSVYPQ